MNSARDIISYAEEHNIQLSARNGQLILNASKEVLTDDFLQKAKTYKPELLKALEDRRTHVQKLISSACRGLEITPNNSQHSVPKRIWKTSVRGQLPSKHYERMQQVLQMVFAPGG